MPRHVGGTGFGEGAIAPTTTSLSRIGRRLVVRAEARRHDEFQRRHDFAARRLHRAARAGKSAAPRLFETQHYDCFLPKRRPPVHGRASFPVEIDHVLYVLDARRFAHACSLCRPVPTTTPLADGPLVRACPQSAGAPSSGFSSTSTSTLKTRVFKTKSGLLPSGPFKESHECNRIPDLQYPNRLHDR